MCGRYALGIRATFIRHQLQQHDMPVDEAPEDDDFRQSFNFAPGYHGLVYRADVPDHGANSDDHVDAESDVDAPAADKVGEQPDTPDDRGTRNGLHNDVVHKPSEKSHDVRYKLQSMKWGLVPFWTKRNPDYGSMLKTINARDDSLMENRGMWNTMKQKKRCIVVAQGFYEWLKKPGGREKVPHYVKRSDEQLMCFAGLWDCVKFEGSEEKLYTYTIITTDSNTQLKFLHDRMPVILENGSDEIRTWLDPARSSWSKELQSLLKPFPGQLECYPVSKDVGKVGNNSPSFIIPVASSENKNNIANFFSNSTGMSKPDQDKSSMTFIKTEPQGRHGIKDVQLDEGDPRPTVDEPRSEDNAPVPVESKYPPTKRKLSQTDDPSKAQPSPKATKVEPQSSDVPTEVISRKTRSATFNGSAAKGSPAKASGGSQRITNFFNK
ncbi:hypothetical protein MMC25_005569 [Agyrium rufum]|nr:hypothetical protein [Agyrium rufum]